MDECALADLNLEAWEEEGREWQLALVSDKLGHALCPSKRIRLACGWFGLTGRVSRGCGLVRVETSDLWRQRALNIDTCLMPCPQPLSVLILGLGSPTPEPPQNPGILPSPGRCPEQDRGLPSSTVLLVEDKVRHSGLDRQKLGQEKWTWWPIRRRSPKGVGERAGCGH